MTGAVVVNMRRLPKPIVAAVNGTCAGAGAVIALAADIRIAAEGAKFAYLFTKVGLSGADMGAAFLLPRIVGLGRATEILMTSDAFDAAEAHRIGLVNKVVPADKVLEEAIALAHRLAKGPAYGIAVTKQMLNAEASMNVEQAVETEAIVQALCMHHGDFREAYEAFVGKREPKFGKM
jgi:enoyl-CoA hydratase/carnithine racemase